MNGLLRGLQMIWEMIGLLIAEVKVVLDNVRRGKFELSPNLLELLAIAEMWLQECSDSRGRFNLNTWKLLGDPFKESRRAFQEYKARKQAED